jgi:hypothetical protein
LLHDLLDRDLINAGQFVEITDAKIADKALPAGEAFTAVHGSTQWNYNTAHQWKRDMDRNLQAGMGIANAPRWTSTTEVAYRLDPPDQPRPSGISSDSVPGRIFETLSNAVGKPLRPGKIMDAVWTDPDRVGSLGNLQVQIHELKDAGVGIKSTGCIFLRPYDGCEADREPRLFEFSE